MTHHSRSTPEPARATEPIARREWTRPVVEDLPPLTELTLQTGDPIPGFGGGGSTVF